MNTESNPRCFLSKRFVRGVDLAVQKLTAVITLIALVLANPIAGNGGMTVGVILVASLNANPARSSEVVQQQHAGSPSIKFGSCGLIALQQLARALNGARVDIKTLWPKPLPAKGFTVSQIVELGGQAGLTLVAAKWPIGEPLPVPSIVHYSEGHFVAVIEGGYDSYKVFDSMKPGPQWLSSQALRELSSGNVLLLSEEVPSKWLKVDPQEQQEVAGGEICLRCMGDLHDGCKNNNNACWDCSGMARWAVSEPYINVWLHDEPLGYQPGLGERISFKLSYKQRADFSVLANSFNFGNNWNSSLLSFVLDDNVSGLAYLEAGGGGERNYEPNGISVEYFTQSIMERQVDGGGALSGFVVRYNDGTVENYFEISPNAVLGYTAVYLTERTDPFGHSTQYFYSVDGSGNFKLDSVVDGDGTGLVLSYGNVSAPCEVTTVSDPFGRHADLSYDSSGNLTNVTDVQGLSSAFVYNGDGSVTNLITPYGTTSFSYATNTTGTNVISRSVQVVDPAGATNIYAFRFVSQYLDDSTNNIPLLPSSYPTNMVPTNVPTSTIDNGGTVPLYMFNSFHWGPLQCSHLSTMVLTNLGTNDYNLALMKNWLVADSYGNVEHTINLQREPSPDGVRLGQITWYDYDGKSAGVAYQDGIDFQPALVARVLPDETTAYTWFVRDGWRHATNIVSTFSSGFGAPVACRTNIITYDATNDIDLISITGPTNETLIKCGYDAKHRVVQLTNGVNDVASFSYDSIGRLTSVKSFSGLTTTNLYPGGTAYTNFVQTRIDLEINRTNTFSYLDNLIAVHTNELGLISTNLYDNLQRLTNTSNPNGTVSIIYSNLNVSKVIDRLGNTNTFGFDPDGRVTAVTNALGHYLLFDYCGCGALNSIQDSLGNPTTFSYNNAGWRTNIQYADTYAVNYGYDLMGRPTNVIDSGGFSYTNWFNNQGRLYAVSNAIGQMVRLSFNEEDRATNVINLNGISIDLTYDVLGRNTSRSYPDGGSEGFGYSAAGLIWYTNRLGKLTTNIFDVARRLVATTNANLEGMGFTYDAAGNLLRLTDGKGQTTTWTYDVFGRVSNKVDNLGNTVLSYKYDANNRATNRHSITKGDTGYAWDAAGNLTNITYNVSPSISFAYDALNRLTSMVDVSGTNTFGYDSVGELTSVDGPWADDTVTYTYANRLRDSLKIGQPDGDTWVQSYGYDDARRLTNITTSAGSYGYQYDSSRKMMVGRLTFPNSAYVTNNYDSMARLLSTVLETSGNSILDSESYAYNLGSQRTNETFTAGNYLSLGYDNIGQLTSATGLEAGGGTNRLQEQFQYAYDAAHNLNIRTNNGLVQTFNTDPVNRLTNVTRNTGHIFTVAGTTTSQASSVNVSKDSGSPVGTALYGDFTFASTNLFVLTDGTNTFTAVASDAYGRSDTNAVTVNLPVTNSFTYDLNGNLLGDGTRAFDYDDENRLIHITVTNAWRSEFTYDGLMRRRVRMEFTWQYGGWVKTNEVRYVYDGNVVVQERDTNNLPTVTYTRGKDLGGGLQYAGGIGGLLARRDRTTGQTAFYHSDGNGNVKALINAAQAIVAKYSYDPFGNLQSSSGPLADVNLYRFSSKEHHEASDLTYYGRRFYNANLQRWMNQDPIAEAGDINLYRPMENQPTGQIDGLGLDNPIPQLGWIGGSIENYPQQLWVTGTYQSAGPITVTNVGGDPYMQMLLGGIAVGGLAATAIAVSPPLLMAYQIKSNIDELNNENNDTLTRVGNGLQLFGNIILAVVPLAGCVKTALSVRSAASIAAEGGTTALQPMADAAFQTGTIRNVAGYELGGNAGLAGNTYNVNLWGLYATENAQGPFALVNALKGEASAAGASQISITGNAVVNQGLLNIGPGVASRLGFQFQQINPTTILLQGAVH